LWVGVTELSFPFAVRDWEEGDKLFWGEDSLVLELANPVDESLVAPDSKRASEGKKASTSRREKCMRIVQRQFN
jgi:hypothetical protein